MSSSPSYFREEIQTLVKKCQELEEIRRAERDNPVEMSPEVWLSWASDFLCKCRGALGLSGTFCWVGPLVLLTLALIGRSPYRPP